VGSPFSTFTGVIAWQRERVQLKDPATGGLLPYAGPPPSGWTTFSPWPSTMISTYECVHSSNTALL
jgi:hypothetical protein